MAEVKEGWIGWADMMNDCCDLLPSISLPVYKRECPCKRKQSFETPNTLMPSFSLPLLLYLCLSSLSQWGIPSVLQHYNQLSLPHLIESRPGSAKHIGNYIVRDAIQQGSPGGNWLAMSYFGRAQRCLFSLIIFSCQNPGWPQVGP